MCRPRPRNSSRSPSNKPLIQVFIFSSRCCFKECFLFPTFPTSSVPSGTSVVICNTAVILLSDFVFLQKHLYHFRRSLSPLFFSSPYTLSIPLPRQQTR